MPRTPETHTSRRRVTIRAALLALLLLATAAPSLEAQDTARAKNWYDTLTVTRPRYARSTANERIALAAFMTLALPVGLAIGATTIVPPSVSVLLEDGRMHTGVLLTTGIGFGGDTTQLAYFPIARFQVEGGYYINRDQPFVVRGTVLYDYRFSSIHPRDFFWLGAAAGVGATTDFAGTSPHAELWFGIMNPLGIRYMPYFPMHNYGVRARVGYDIDGHRPWYELAISATSTFEW